MFQPLSGSPVASTSRLIVPQWLLSIGKLLPGIWAIVAELLANFFASPETFAQRYWSVVLRAKGDCSADKRPFRKKPPNKGELRASLAIVPWGTPTSSKDWPVTRVEMPIGQYLGQQLTQREPDRAPPVARGRGSHQYHLRQFSRHHARGKLCQRHAWRDSDHAL